MSHFKGKTIKDLKQMIAEPASKEWFKKHDKPTKKYNPKGKALNDIRKSGFSPQGVRYLSKKESAEKTKNWPKAKKHSKADIIKFLGE